MFYVMFTMVVIQTSAAFDVCDVINVLPRFLVPDFMSACINLKPEYEDSLSDLEEEEERLKDLKIKQMHLAVVNFVQGCMLLSPLQFAICRLLEELSLI